MGSCEVRKSGRRELQEKFFVSQITELWYKKDKRSTKIKRKIAGGSYGPALKSVLIREEVTDVL